MQGKGKKTSFVFRFPKFDNPGYVYYDPSITLDAEGSNGAAQYAASFVLVAAAILMTALGVTSA